MNFREQLIATGCDADTVDQFIAYHKQNPDIWKSFEAMALSIAGSGRKRYSAKTIIEVIRWNTDRISILSEFKISNSFTAYYSRIFMIKHPQYDGFFETHEVKGFKKAA